MFTNAQNFKIDNSQFTNVITHHHSPGLTGIDILLEASIPQAAYDSSARDPPPRCFPGTRGEYIEDIIQWAIPPLGGTSTPIYWMKGPAGVGKSAVAQTCVEKLKRLSKLSPAFFFSMNGRNKHQKFFPSIAYQLATINPDYHDLIDKKIHRNKTLVDKTMETQFWELIVEPLRELESAGKGVGTRIPVFVDGLDECESQDAQCEIIDIVASAARDGVVPLCWAFFSRPEPHIDATFSKPTISPLCYKSVLPITRDADGDIELYLRDGFENILRRLNITTDPPWPSDRHMKELVCAASGLFIYAKTILRFVGQPDTLNPEELLRIIISIISNRNQRGTTTESAFAELDAFYTLIMRRIPAKIFPIIHRVLAILCESNFSCAIMIANVLGLSRMELEAACNYLNAVVNFQHQGVPLSLDPTTEIGTSFLHVNLRLTMESWIMIAGSLGGSISFYHKSFQDFLLDPVRSGPYYITTETMSEHFIKRQLSLALQFESRHSWRGSELIRTPGSPDSASNLSYPYANELVNSLIEACLYGDINGESTPLGADFDFRKQLYVATSIAKTIFTTQRVPRGRLHQCAAFSKYIHWTILSWIQPGEFPNFDVAAFKERIEEQQRKNIMRPYYTAAPFLSNPQGRVESGLYVIGRDSKSVFWYWEINYDLETYREFRTLYLVEGETLYREGWFDSYTGPGVVAQAD